MGRKFNKLANKVEREYEKKGISAKIAKKWADATAGKVYRERLRKRKVMV